MKIEGKDAYHIAKVLRMTVGTQLQIVSSDHVTALMKIEAVTEGVVFVCLIKKMDISHEPSVKVVLGEGLAKGEKMDFIIQKAVEVGVSVIVPVTMEHCVVKFEEQKAHKKLERWQKIAEEAAKQCKRDIVPSVMPLQTFEEVIRKNDCDLKIIASESEMQVGLKSFLQSQKAFSSILVIIGPEGGIHPAELQFAEANNVQAITLGKRILRTETAGLVTAAAIFYETGDLGG